MNVGKVPPDGFLRCLSKADRVKMFPGTAGLTRKECAERYDAGQEKQLQQDICAWLKMQPDCFVEMPPRMDKRTTLQKGRPDFVACVCGIYLAIEAKASGGLPTSEQAAFMDNVSKAKGRTLLAYNLKSVISVVNGIRAEVRIAKEALERDGWRNKE